MNKSILQSFCMVALLVCALPAAEAKDAPKKDPHGKSVGDKKSAPAKLTEKQALALIQGRPDVKDFFTNVTKSKIAKPVIEIDRTEGNCYVIHVYELVPDGPDSSHTATMNWYKVDFNTKKVTSEF